MQPTHTHTASHDATIPAGPAARGSALERQSPAAAPALLPAAPPGAPLLLCTAPPAVPGAAEPHQQPAWHSRPAEGSGEEAGELLHVHAWAVLSCWQASAWRWPNCSTAPPARCGIPIHWPCWQAYLCLELGQHFGSCQLSSPRRIHRALCAALLASRSGALLRQLMNEGLLLSHALGAQLCQQGALLLQPRLVSLDLQEGIA